MATISSKLRIQIALRSKPSSESVYNFDPGDPVHVFLENYEKWNGLYIFEKNCNKDVYLNLDGAIKHFNTSEIMPNRNDVADPELEWFREYI